MCMRVVRIVVREKRRENRREKKERNKEKRRVREKENERKKEMRNPMEQFRIESYGMIDTISVYTIIVIMIIIYMVIVQVKSRKNEGIMHTVISMIGEGREKMIMIMTIMTYVWVSNTIGLIPYTHTITSQLSIVIGMSIGIWIGIVVEGIRKRGKEMMSIMIPEGVPTWLIPLLTIIESISYMARSISLGLRLGCNMIAGRILLEVVATIGQGGKIVGMIGIGMIVGIMMLEIGVGVLQSYVMTTLIVSYLREI